MGELIFRKVLLKDLPTYGCNIDFFGYTLYIDFTWIGRLNKRAISISLKDGTVLLQNTVVTVGESYKFNNIAKNLGLPCQIFLDFDSTKNQNEDYLNWSKNMQMFVYLVTED